MARVLVKDTNPVAVVLPYAGATAPTGWLLCDGSAVSRTVFASLFASIGTTYGSGDGLSTFNLPDMRGVFVRGAGSQTISGQTYTGTLGTKQGDQMQGHKHTDSGHTHTGSTPAQTATGLVGGGGTISLSAGNTTNPVTINSSTANLGDPTATTYGTPRIGTQTHPANMALNYIIKA